jgi:hypothetical protein
MSETVTATLPFAPGEPTTHRGIVVCPLFPVADPVASYLTLDEALPRGLAISEVSESGSVPQLAVSNPLDERVLLFDGEELVGAKQNRILNVSVLVEAGTTLPIPVSCVEEGRWSRRSAFFDSAAHFAHPEVRRSKAEALAAQPLALGAAQRTVWESVRAKSDRMGVSSPTAAQSDLFASHEAQLDELADAFPLRPGQAGALLALGDTVCLDWVSRPEAFERLWPKLRQGYLLDAVEQLDGPAAGERLIAGFVRRVAAATRTRQRSPGLGDDVRLRGDGLVGSGLELDGELLQLSAFSSDGGASRAFGRIARPSSRR